MKKIINFNKFITENFKDKIIDIAKSDMELARQLATSQGSTLDEIFKSNFSEIINVEFVVDDNWEVYDMNIKFKISDLKINQEDELELYCEVDKSSYVFIYDNKYSFKDILDDFRDKHLNLSDFYSSDDIMDILRNNREWLKVQAMIMIEEHITSKLEELDEFYLQIFYKCY
jgi:hypothetical protein